MSRWIPIPQIYNLSRVKLCLYIQDIKVITFFSYFIIIVVVLLKIKPSSSAKIYIHLHSSRRNLNFHQNFQSIQLPFLSFPKPSSLSCSSLHLPSRASPSFVALL